MCLTLRFADGLWMCSVHRSNVRCNIDAIQLTTESFSCNPSKDIPIQFEKNEQKNEHVPLVSILACCSQCKDKRKISKSLSPHAPNTWHKHEMNKDIDTSVLNQYGGNVMYPFPPSNGRR